MLLPRSLSYVCEGSCCVPFLASFSLPSMSASVSRSNALAVWRSHIFAGILAGMTSEFNCEVVPQEMITHATNLAHSLMGIKEQADEATRGMETGDFYLERRYQAMGLAAQLAYAFGEFAHGGFGDLLFKVTKAAVSCANAGLELLEGNIQSQHRWIKLVERLNKLQFDTDRLLRSPLFL